MSDPSSRLPELIRARDLEERGIPRRQLNQMLRRGEIERVERGVYLRVDAPVTELVTVASVSKRIPGGVICLLTALAIHQIGTQLPPHVWIAIDRKARKPRTAGVTLRVVRFSPRLMTYGIEMREAMGVPFRITSPARTVVDCFRYRNKVGLDVAMEALRDAVRSRKASVAQIWRAADVCRVRTVVAPYLDALSAS